MCYIRGRISGFIMVENGFRINIPANNNWMAKLPLRINNYGIIFSHWPKPGHHIVLVKFQLLEKHVDEFKIKLLGSIQTYKMLTFFPINHFSISLKFLQDLLHGKWEGCSVDLGKFFVSLKNFFGFYTFLRQLDHHIEFHHRMKTYGPGILSLPGILLLKLLPQITIPIFGDPTVSFGIGDPKYPCHICSRVDSRSYFRDVFESNVSHCFKANIYGLKFKFSPSDF